MPRNCGVSWTPCARRPAATSRSGSARAEKRLDKSVGKLDERTRELERRFEAFEQDRKYAEWRIHTNTEAMLDGLLREVRAIADLLTKTR